MIQEKIVRSIIAPVVVAGILILAVSTAIPSNALMTYSSSEYDKCVKSSNNCFLLNNESSNAGNRATSQEASNTGNAAQESSNTGNAAKEASNNGQTGQGGTSSQAGHCKPTITLSASWYPPYQNYMIRGTLACGGSGLSGKTITLTSSKLSYVGALGTVVTREDGSFYKSYKPASTAKPLTTLSAWFLGGPDEGGIASKVVTPQGGPQSSNAESTN